MTSTTDGTPDSAGDDVTEPPGDDVTEPSGDDVTERSGDGGAADDGADASTGRDRRRRYAPWVAAGLSVVTVLAALTACALMGWQLWSQHRIDAAGQRARETAIGYAETLTSIDADRVDENFARVLNGATGEFKDMYTQSSVQLRQLLVDNKATAHGTVVDSAIQHASEDSVTVLLMVDQTVTNAARPDPRVDRSRMKITMQRVDDRWLANKVELP